MQLIPEAQEVLNGIKNETLTLNDVIHHVYTNINLKPYLKLYKRTLFPNYYNSDFDMINNIIFPLINLCSGVEDAENKINIFCNFIEEDDFNRVYKSYDDDNDEEYEYTMLSSLISRYSYLMPHYHFIHIALNITGSKVSDTTIDCIFDKLRLNMVHDKDTQLSFNDARDDAECIGYLYHLNVLDNYLKKNNYENIEKVINTGNPCVQLAVIEWSGIDINTHNINFTPVVSYSYDKNGKSYEIHYPQ